MEVCRRVFFALLMIATVVVIDVNDVSASSIRDGNATWNDGGYRPQDATDVQKSVRDAWMNKKIPSGGKDINIHKGSNGRFFPHDVYNSGSPSVAGASDGWVVKKHGGKDYFEFSGWSVLLGAGHHKKNNQATYIGAVKSDGERKIYKTRMLHAHPTSKNGNKEIYFGGKRWCNSNERFKSDSECNMEYRFAGFRAYLPLEDLFPNGGEIWSLYLIKNVSGHMVYTPLYIPFDKTNRSWKNPNLNNLNGELSLKSSADVDLGHSVRPTGQYTLKKKSANPSSGSTGYFVRGKKYRITGINETTGVTNWFRLRVPEENNANRWASSTYLRYTGSVARLTWNRTQAIVKVNHIDKDTNEVLETNEYKRTLNKSYTFTAKTKGTLTDNKGRPYIASPSRAEQRKDNVKITGDMTINFYYKIATADVTIKHVDSDTGKVLDTETSTVDVDKEYSFKPKTKGTFKDGEGNPYIASPLRNEQEFKEVIEKDTTITFYYRVYLPDPSDEYPLPDATKGKVDGHAYWELEKFPERIDETYLRGIVNFVQAGTHYETRNHEHKIKLADNDLLKGKDPLVVWEFAGGTNGKKMLYNYEYEYTNHYRDNYKCVDGMQGANEYYCFKWEFDERTPVWDEGETFSLADHVKKGEKYVELLLDHRFGETIKKDSIEEILEEEFIVGKLDEYKKNVKKDTTFYEEFEKAVDEFKDKLQLKTQSSINIKPDTMKYSVSVPSKEHEDSGYNVLQKALIEGRYFPVDVDESLKEDLENHSDYDYGDYAIFLQQEKMKDKGIHDDKRQFEMEFVSDYFFMSEHTGFISTYPYAYQLNRHLKWGDTKPVEDDIVYLTKNTMSQGYFRDTGEEFKEGIIGISDDRLEDKEKLQRYYLPVSPESELDPNEDYTNKVVLENIGLNNTNWEYEQQFSFEHYLFGSGHDDAWIIEQAESKISDFNSSDVNTIVIKNEDKSSFVELIQERTDFKLHGFRAVDREFIEKVNEIIGVN